MTRLAQSLSCLAMTALPLVSGAAQHFICYEGESQQSQATAIFGCHEDAGGTCQITMTSPGSGRAQVPLGLPGTYESIQLPPGSLASASISFFNNLNQPIGAPRHCEVYTLGPGARGAASPGAQLTGFTTDASGLVTTGVWKVLSANTASANRVVLSVPADFVAVGGGAMGKEVPLGALVTESYQSDTMGSTGVADWRRWTVKTSDLVWPDPHQTTAYAIGMRIVGLHARDLQPLLRVIPQANNPAMASVAVNRAMVPTTPIKVSGGFVPLSGGVAAFADASNSPFSLLGQFVTVTAPLVPACTRMPCKPLPITGWRVESKDHLVAHPGIVNTALLGLPAIISVGGARYAVQSRLVSATSGMAPHPAVDVSGLRGQYALTGIGAAVAWRTLRDPLTRSRPGNLIWKLEPRPDLGGATVASKDHGLGSDATITGYALGIKLVLIK